MLHHPLPQVTFLFSKLTALHPFNPHTFLATSSKPVPTNYGVVLFPAFQLLDVFGPLDALSLLAITNKVNLYTIAATKSPVSNQPRAASMNRLNSTVGQNILPSHTFDAPPDSLDVLIVPGGLGTRAPDLNNTIDFIRSTYPKLQYILSVCTGAELLAKAGIVDGKRATTNKAAWNSTIVSGPNTTWIPQARWVEDGNVWTSSGISAGMDLTLAFIERMYGRATADRVTTYLEYERHEDPSWDPFAVYWNLTTAT